MASLADVYRALNAMQADGVVENYAVGGGMAALFYAETTRTFDVDVFTVFPQSGLLVDLSPLYRWCEAKGYLARDEYVVMHGVPVQLLAANPGVELEAVQNANVLDYDGVPIRVMKPEYLVILYIITGGDKRRGRTKDLFAEGAIDDNLLHDILKRHQLIDVWKAKGG